MRFAALALSLSLVFFATGSSFAKGKPDKPGRGNGNSQGRGNGQGRGGAAKSSHRFQAQDVDIIWGYYHGGGGSLPPGLAKRGSLPPGLEKQLRRNGTLPPGLQKKLMPFPAGLDARLGPVPYGYRRVMLDRWAMLVHDSTNVIFDIIDLTRR